MWPTSPERRETWVRRQIFRRLLIGSAALALILWLYVLSVAVESHHTDVDAKVWILSIVLTVTPVVLGLTMFAEVGTARFRFEERMDRERRDQLRADRDEQVSPSALSELLAANRALLNAYQQPVRDQARTSYVYGQVAILVGLAVLIIGAVVVLASGEAAARISVAGLAAVGGALSGYVARTYLRIYEHAQEQLNFYFREPLVTSYLLTAERLADKLEGERKQEAYALMVRDIVRSVRDDIDPDSAGRPLAEAIGEQE